MKLRILLALALVVALVFGTGLFAAAADDDPKCWWLGYSVEMRGKPLVKIPNTCVPCIALCHYLPPPPGASSRSASLSP